MTVERVQPDQVPEELRLLPQWVRWKSIPADPKPRKVPVHPSRPTHAAVDDPKTWGTLDEVLRGVGKHGTCGPGFVFTDADPYAGVDLDNCRNPETGELTEDARAIVASFATYTEVSPSGRGVHLILRASLGGGRKVNGFEAYDHGRYFTVTGQHLEGTPLEVADAQPALDAFVARYLLPRTPLPRQPVSSDVPLTTRINRAAKYLAAIPAAVAGQGGHQAAWNAALCVVRGFALPVDTALELFREEYNPRCKPPWSEKEMLHKLTGASEDSHLPEGYLLDARPPRRPRGPVATAGGGDSEVGEPPAEPYSHAVAALTSGQPVPEFLPLVAQVSNEILRSELVARIAHERHVPLQAIRAELRKLRPRRGLRAVEPAGEQPGLPEIRLEPGELHHVADRAELALLADTAGAQLFQRGGLLVRVIRTEALTVRRGVHRPIGSLVIHQLETAYLQKRLTGSARWRKYDGRSQDWVPTDAPTRVAEILQAGQGDWRFRPLIGLLEAPTLRPDGSVLSEPGYDDDTGLLLDPGYTEFPGVPENPTRGQALEALQRLLELLQDFPFVAESDRSAALSALLTGLVRKSLRSAPLHAFRAPKMRSGKTLLADLVALLATGRTCAVLSQNYDKPDEEKKRLLAVLLAGDPVICWDNIDRPFGGAAIAQALTQETISDRVLGATQMATAPTAATFLATGNNLIFEGDITSRVVPCDLDPQMEKPEERRFAQNLYEHVPAQRGALVCAALTVLRAYHVAGRPSQRISQWGGFEEWSDWVRASLVWLGQADPVVGRARVEDLDPVRQDLRQLMVAWHDAFGIRAATVSEAIKAAKQNAPDLNEAFVQVAGTSTGEIHPRRLGNLLSAHQNRIESGYRIRRFGTVHGGALAWQVEQMRGDTGDTGDTALYGASKDPITQENGYFGKRHMTTSPVSPVSPETAQQPLPCPDCGSSDSRLSRLGRPICNRCWPPGPQASGPKP